MKLFLCPNLIFTSRAIVLPVFLENAFHRAWSGKQVLYLILISNRPFLSSNIGTQSNPLANIQVQRKKRNLTDLCITYLCQGNHQLGASGVREICQPHPTTFRKQKSNKRFTRSFMKSMLCPLVNHTEGVSFEMMISCKPYELILRQYCMAHHSKKIEM